ncbi:hypothetical protein [Streptomyces sp. NBC_01803]|uniref:hypothetical protein n=1 Tax=Streptomyces sp. NBC_01803 TaxID=2975946 RepID=UPI002DDBC190|nr:hypothetical protein [Streptomyces sp. NBC_01803]WSA45428.1 hypothetical protein OIE51_15170 [Streptomyces sp. NBC_01803]
MPAIGLPEREHKDGSRHWHTLPERKNVLVVAHTIPYGKRLRDVIHLLAPDLRLHVHFAAPPHEFGDGVTRFLRRLGGSVMPWRDVIRTPFDLALAAGPRDMGEIQAPVITIPHGANYLKRISGTADLRVPGLSREDIVLGEGSLPAAVVLPHRDDRAQLARSCPEALPVATVIGDPVHDRITASLPLRDLYREALGLREGQKLLAAVSTWGPLSSFGKIEALLPRLLGELDGDDIRAAILVHPNVWSRYGAWQMHSWLARCAERGIAVLPPEADWRTVLIAADWIIGDHGSVTLYGTLTPAPILLDASPRQEMNPESPAATLALTAPALSPTHPLRDQLHYAEAEYRRQDYVAIASRITSEPGRFNENMRHLLYRVLGLGRPAFPAPTHQLPPPAPLDAWIRRETPA